MFHQEVTYEEGEMVRIVSEHGTAIEGRITEISELGGTNIITVSSEPFAHKGHALHKILYTPVDGICRYCLASGKKKNPVVKMRPLIELEMEDIL